MIHDRALAALLRSVDCHPGQNRIVMEQQLTDLRIVIKPGDTRLAEIGWDELWLAEDFCTTEVKDPCRWEGLGVPLIVYRGKRDRSHYPERAYPPHWKFAATAVSHLGDGTLDGPLEILVIDPREVKQVVTGQLVWPLAADLTTPLIHLLSQSHYRNKAVAGLFLPEQLTDFDPPDRTLDKSLLYP